MISSIFHFKTTTVVFSFLLAVSVSAHAVGSNAPRDAELRSAVASLRTSAFADESARNTTMNYLERLSRNFPDDPYISVQLANIYGLQARYAKKREVKAIWAAKADNILNEVIAANPHYLLAQATRGVQMVMAPAMMGLEAPGERQLKEIIAANMAHSKNEDDDEAVIISHIFLGVLYDRQAEALSGAAQAEKRRDADRIRSDLKKRYPNFDITRFKNVK